MSKKKERIQKLIKIHSRLNTPVKGASDKAEYSTYRKDCMIDSMKLIEQLLADDGIFASKGE